jgi:transposase InsO family protein
MPWKESYQMDERVKFIGRLLEGERMSELCKEFGISRRTGYKFRQRYLNHGIRGLADQSRRPQFHPHKTAEPIEQLIIKLRKLRPSWGPKKIKARLETDNPGIKIPVASTIDEILTRYGVPKQKAKRRRRRAEGTGPLKESRHPNEIWCVDFKGQFRLGNRKYCYPLTVSDHYSRYLLECEALENTSTNGVWSAFERVFQEHGLPQIIRSDNGTPFSSRALNGWSRLSVWWLRLGIKLERIEPGHPEQNGRHERIHWTLKNEATRPASPNLFHQQARFDDFRHDYNYYRPHESLNMKTPSSFFQNSAIKYPKRLPDLNYPMYDLVRRVDNNGSVTLRKGLRFQLSSALGGEVIGLREIRPFIWLVTFMKQKLGYLERRKLNYFMIKNHSLRWLLKQNVSPMFPVQSVTYVPGCTPRRIKNRVGPRGVGELIRLF